MVKSHTLLAESLSRDYRYLVLSDERFGSIIRGRDNQLGVVSKGNSVAMGVCSSDHVAR